MIVLIAGLQRSGSTFAFNIVRDTLLRRGSVYQESRTPEVLRELNEAGDVDHILLKIHDVEPFGILLGKYGGAKVICTIRNPEDAVASWMETFGFSEDEAISTIQGWLKLYKSLKPFALTVPYKTIDQHPFKAAWQIARFIIPDATPLEIWRSARQHAKAEVKKRTDALNRNDPNIHDLGFSYYDEKTFLHRRHISSLKSQPASARLSQDQLQRIRSRLAPDLAAADLNHLF